MDGDDRLMGVEEGLVSRNWLAMPIHRWRCSRVDWRRVGHPRARMTRPSIGRRSAVRGSATNSGPGSDHHMKREQIPGTGGKQDDHGATANHRGACEADARQSVDGSAVASGRRRPSLSSCRHPLPLPDKRRGGMDRRERSPQHRVMIEEPMPPLGVRLTVDVQAREGARGTTYYARVRWTHPVTHHREGVKRTHGSVEEALAWVERLEGAARTGVDPGQPLANYVAQLGDRWARGIDPTSTLDPYSAGLRKRVLPALGHLPVSMMSVGLNNRAIDQWEAAYGRSTVKNTIAAWCWCWTR